MSGEPREGETRRGGGDRGTRNLVICLAVIEFVGLLLLVIFMLRSR